MSSENRDFVHFFDNSLDMLCIAGLDGYFKTLNPAWSRTLGYTTKELVAEPYINFIHPDDLQNTLHEAAKLNQGETTILFENRYRCKDGTYRWLLWQASPDLTRGLIYASARDISPRKALEQQLIEMTELQRAILDGANSTIISTSPDGIIKTFNAAAQRDLGYSAEEVIGRVTPAIFHLSEEIERRANELSEALGATVEPGFEAFVAKARLGQPDENEWTYVRKDGTQYPVMLSVTALFDRDRNVQGFLGVGQDITERKKAEADLRRSNQELEQFAYIASHDLHEPLRMVTSYLQLLERRSGSALDGEALSYLNTAIEGAKRMRILIQDLLAYSRVGTRGNPLIPTDMSGVLKIALSNLEIAVETSKAVVNVDPLPFVIGDSIQLVQLLQNLISNSIKFCSKHPPVIHIQAVRDGPRWTISVTDNGIGIDSKSFDRIFLVFQRLHTHEEYAGTGIGLAVCKRIVERHGGRIWVESSVGKGSTFFFTLEASPEKKLPQKEAV